MLKYMNIILKCMQSCLAVPDMICRYQRTCICVLFGQVLSCNEFCRNVNHEHGTDLSCSQLHITVPSSTTMAKTHYSDMAAYSQCLVIVFP